MPADIVKCLQLSRLVTQYEYRPVARQRIGPVTPGQAKIMLWTKQHPVAGEYMFPLG